VIVLNHEEAFVGLECTYIDYCFVIFVDNETLPHIEPSLALLNLTTLIQEKVPLVVILQSLCMLDMA
jgi:hypothetical protein